MNAPFVILFDGVCVLCNTSVDFVIKRDKMQRFSYLPLQSDEGKAFLQKHRYHSDLETILLYRNGTFFEKSDAILEILRHLRFWKLLYFLKIIPKGWRDRIYDLIAKYRYKIFGKKEHCRIIR